MFHPKIVLAHIRNGQATSGPVGLLAGLTVARASAAAANDQLERLSALTTAHDDLTAALAGTDCASADDYLLLPLPKALIDLLIAAAGGMSADGTGLATVAPTDKELAIAREAPGSATEAAILADWKRMRIPRRCFPLCATGWPNTRTKSLPLSPKLPKARVTNSIRRQMKGPKIAGRTPDCLMRSWLPSTRKSFRQNRLCSSPRGRPAGLVARPCPQGKKEILPARNACR